MFRKKKSLLDTCIFKYRITAITNFKSTDFYTNDEIESEETELTMEYVSLGKHYTGRWSIGDLKESADSVEVYERSYHQSFSNDYALIELKKKIYSEGDLLEINEKLKMRIVNLEIENKQLSDEIQQMKEQAPSNQCLNNIQRDILKEIQEINSKIK